MKISKLFITILLNYSLILVCAQTSDTQSKLELAKFEPADGKCLFFIGHDMQSTGGLNQYTDGYCDYFDMPSGITVYTGLIPGVRIYDYAMKGLDGLKTKVNWGSGDCCVQCYIEDPDFKYNIIAIGLTMVKSENKIAKGLHDDLVRELGEWIKEIKRPVFLKIGYEFDDLTWHKYERKHFLKAWKRIHSIFNEMNVHNVAFVWQSKGFGSDQKTLEKWYPGDEYVDWCAYSYFGNPDEEMLHFARRHKKPVFIADATPVLQDGSLYFNANLMDSLVAKRIWKKWFIPFINTLNNNKDVIKAFSYSNTNWPSQPIWLYSPTFQKVDARIQVSEFVSEKWKNELAKPRYLKSSPELWKHINIKKE